MNAASKARARRARAVPVTAEESINPAVEAMHQAIVERAQAIFSAQQRAFDAALDDWLAAEGELLWRPAIRLLEKSGRIRLEVAVAGVKPSEIEVQVSGQDVLIQSTVSYDYRPRRGILHVCEFQPGRLFRVVRLPRPIDPDSVRASCRDGLLKVTARNAGPADSAPGAQEA